MFLLFNILENIKKSQLADLSEIFFVWLSKNYIRSSRVKPVEKPVEKCVGVTWNTRNSSRNGPVHNFVNMTTNTALLNLISARM